MQDNDLTPILAVVAFIGLCIIGIAVWRWRAYKYDAQEREQQQAIIDRGVREGVLTPDGHRACIVCGLPATAYMPVSTASWMDRLPLLNRLFSLPPRYVIEDDTHEDVCLCRLHKKFSVAKLEEFHAMLRAERASFNASQADKVAQMDGGALVRLVQQQHKDAVRQLNTDTRTPLPQLSLNASRNEPAVVTLVSTSSTAPQAPRDDDGQEQASGS
jgi:hypothetical protein